jgi:hypothetical protein
VDVGDLSAQHPANALRSSIPLAVHTRGALLRLRDPFYFLSLRLDPVPLIFPSPRALHPGMSTGPAFDQAQISTQPICYRP